jgi:hypothetical protein
MSANRRTKQTSQRFPNGIPRPLGRGGGHFYYPTVGQERGRGRDLRNWFVISVNRAKKVTGKFCFRPRKRIIEGLTVTGKGDGVAVFAQVKHEIDSYFSGVKYCPEKWLNASEEEIVQEVLKRLSVAGLIMHAIPAPGYRFNGEGFVPDPRKRKIVKRVAG